jgi:hypothetical protein
VFPEDEIVFIEKNRQIMVEERLSAAILMQVGSEVLTPMTMKSSIFWDITPSSPLKVKWRFEEHASIFRV